MSTKSLLHSTQPSPRHQSPTPRNISPSRAGPSTRSAFQSSAPQKFCNKASWCSTQRRPMCRWQNEPISSWPTRCSSCCRLAQVSRCGQCLYCVSQRTKTRWCWCFLQSCAWQNSRHRSLGSFPAATLLSSHVLARPSSLPLLRPKSAFGSKLLSFRTRQPSGAIAFSSVGRVAILSDELSHPDSQALSTTQNKYGPRHEHSSARQRYDRLTADNADAPRRPLSRR